MNSPPGSCMLCRGRWATGILAQIDTCTQLRTFGREYYTNISVNVFEIYSICVRAHQQAIVCGRLDTVAFIYGMPRQKLCMVVLRVHLFAHTPLVPRPLCTTYAMCLTFETSYGQARHQL